MDMEEKKKKQKRTDYVFVFDPNRPQTRSMTRAISLMTQSSSITHHEDEDEDKDEEDRISQLPDDILHHILHLIPFKSAVGISTLSNRWKELWETVWAHTTCLDFGREFATGKAHPLLSLTINRFLLLHKANTIDSFRLYFPMQKQFHCDINKWIEFARDKGVKWLDLHLTPATWEADEMFKCQSIPPDFLYTLPSRLFSCDTLTILTLFGCNLNPLSTGCLGFSSLKVLSLSRVRITQYCTLEMMLLKCPMLEEVTLMGCYGLRSFGTGTAKASNGLKIKTFMQIGCYGCDNAGLLVSKLAHLQMLTMCHFKIKQLLQYIEIFPITLPNLIELKLGVSDCFGLADMYNLFGVWNFPCLEKLMIEWIPAPEPWINGVMQSSGVFHHLKMIKINGFYGGENQMDVVKFLLQKAIVLETMVLVTHEEFIKGCVGIYSLYKEKLNATSLSLLRERLALLPKGSTKAQVVLYEHAEDDNSSLATYLIGFDCVPK